MTKCYVQPKNIKTSKHLFIIFIPKFNQ